MSLTLYYHPLSSYCQKALVGLYELNAPFEKRLVNLGDSAEADELAKLWPMRKFPVLRDGQLNQTVPESSIIIEHVDLHYPGTARLLPPVAVDALPVRQWDRVFDLHVQDHLQAIVGDRIFKRQGDMQPKYDALATTYGVINEHLANGSSWICGEQFSMADCAAAPALFYASTLQAFGPQEKHLHSYFERLMNRPSVARVLNEAKPYFQFFPFQDRIPERFR